MEKEELFKIFNNSSNLTDFCVRCGIKKTNINGVTISKAREVLNYNGLFFLTEKEKYCRNPKKCLYCGNIISFNKKENKFCNSSCSASYSNKRRIVTEEQKKKTSKTLIGKRTKEIRKKNVKNYSCIICGKNIKKNKTGFCRYCLDYSKEGKELKSKQAKKLMEEGKIKSWSSRNILSYPEKFWIKVLNNNNISYSVNKYFKPYFLDFYIEKNNKKIDLEIDGKQHKLKKRKNSDKKRDAFLKENDFIVYRIKWNSINTDKGKLKMEKKIKLFIDFFNSI